MEPITLLATILTIAASVSVQLKVFADVDDVGRLGQDQVSGLCQSLEHLNTYIADVRFFGAAQELPETAIASLKEDIAQLTITIRDFQAQAKPSKSAKLIAQQRHVIPRALLQRIHERLGMIVETIRTGIATTESRRRPSQIPDRASIQTEGPFLEREPASLQVHPPIRELATTLEQAEEAFGAIVAATKPAGRPEAAPGEARAFNHDGWTDHYSIRLRNKFASRFLQLRTCHLLLLGGVFGIFASLALALWWTIAHGDVGGGFTLGAYVVAVVAFAVGLPTYRHNAHCTCWEKKDMSRHGRAAAVRERPGWGAGTRAAAEQQAGPDVELVALGRSGRSAR